MLVSMTLTNRLAMTMMKQVMVMYWMRNLKGQMMLTKIRAKG